MVLQEAVKVRDAQSADAPAVPQPRDGVDDPMRLDEPGATASTGENAGSAEEEKEELRQKIAAVDATIAALAGVTDEDVQAIVKRKKVERDRLKEALINLKPLKVQLMIATEARDRAARRQAELAEQERNLDVLLEAKRRELREANVDVTKLQVEVEQLSRKQAEKSVAQLRVEALACGLSPASHRAGTVSPCPSQQSAAAAPRSPLH